MLPPCFLSVQNFMPFLMKYNVISSQWETWLGSDVPNSYFLQPGYNTAFCRPSWTSRRLGYHHLPKRQKNFQRPDLWPWREWAWIELKLPSRTRRLLGVWYYRRPSTSVTAVEEFTLALASTMSRVDLKSTDVLIVGDFNAPHVHLGALG